MRQINKKIPVGILGATGTVGQKFIILLDSHPFFEITELVASSRSAGKSYPEACTWKQERPIPDAIKQMTVKSTEEKLSSEVLFSGLDSSVAGEVEEAYAHSGHLIISNAKNHRMDKSVPLVIPEINTDHFSLIKQQPYSGAIVCNSNCSTMFLAMALAPIYSSFGIRAVQVSTMQAISGAGYPGVASLDILGNVVGYISGEEDKLESEPQKILGRLAETEVIAAAFPVSAQCNRVAVVDGHTETVSIQLETRVDPDEIAERLRSFKGMAQTHELPSAPKHPIVVFEEKDRPQPRLDIWTGEGMTTCIGRIRPCSVFDIKMLLMGHNTVRGAAGAAILNGEALVELGYINP